MDLSHHSKVDIIEEEFGKALGAREAAYREKVTLYIAHLDQNGRPVSAVEQWVEKAETVLSKVGGGATSVEVRGAWLGSGAEPLHEPTTLVYSFAPPKAIEESVCRLREFLIHYGKDANQGEVALSLENPDGAWFFRIPREEFWGA